MFSRETLEWLLGPDEPSVRYFTLRDLLGYPVGDQELVAARAEIMSHGPVADILARQNADGGFVMQDMVKRYGEAVALTGYQPKCKATTWQVLFLSQLGADGRDARVKKLCEYVLEHNYSRERRVLGIEIKHRYGVGFFALPCFVGNMVWSLSTLGFYRDYRVRDSIKWLLQYQRFDDGDFRTPDEWPYRGKQHRCFGRHTCFSGCTRALRAMTVVPPEDRTSEMRRFIERAVEFILLHRLYRHSHSTGGPIRKEYTLFTFPQSYYDDIISMVDTLQQLDVADPAMDEALELIISKRTPEGRWKLGYTPSRSSVYANFGTRGRESKWITLRALKILKKARLS
ncbi:MAG TPA: hypothetical protein VK436_06680 [Methanocella sp.]|nr:hypothetical protein [Methanocella sp.]